MCRPFGKARALVGAAAVVFVLALTTGGLAQESPPTPEPSTIEEAVEQARAETTAAILAFEAAPVGAEADEPADPPPEEMVGAPQRASSERIEELSRFAEERFQEALLLEEAAEDEKIRALRAEERETAAKILELTRRSKENFDRLRLRASRLDSTMSDVAVAVRRADLGDEPYPDPRRLRDVLVELYRNFDILSRQFIDSSETLRLRRVQLSAVERALDEFEDGASEIRRREKAVLETNHEYRRLAIELFEAELAQVSARLEELARNRDVFERGLTNALAVATRAQRRPVVGLSDEAVKFAAAAISDRARNAELLWHRAPEQVDLVRRDVTSIDFWVWIAGLFLSVLPLLFFVVFKRWIPTVLDRALDFVNGFASARRNPRFVGRFFELLSATIRPVLNYAVVILVIRYVESRFPGAHVFAELVTAYFVYRVAVAAAAVTRPLHDRLDPEDEEYHDQIRRYRALAGDDGWLAPAIGREIRSTVVEIATVWLVIRIAQLSVSSEGREDPRPGRDHRRRARHRHPRQGLCHRPEVRGTLQIRRHRTREASVRPVSHPLSLHARVLRTLRGVRRTAARSTHALQRPSRTSARVGPRTRSVASRPTRG